MKRRKNPQKLRQRRFWTRSEDETLRSRYPNESTLELAKLFRRSLTSTYQHAVRLGLRKTPEYMASPTACRLRRADKVGAATRFRAGQSPWNKGLKGLDIGGKATQFKKGHRPPHYHPVGTIIEDSDGYLKIKVADPNRWEFIHKRVWAAAHGPIPRGHRLWWKDGDHHNCALNNLELLCGKDHMARTTVHRFPKELAQVIQLAGVLKRRLRSKSNGKEHAGGS